MFQRHTTQEKPQRWSQRLGQSHKIQSNSNIPHPLTHFQELYEYAFKFSKGDKENSRTIDTESAKGMIQILMSGRYELGEKFALFLEQSNYKAMNLDQWMCLLEFARNVKPDLSNLNEKDK